MYIETLKRPDVVAFSKVVKNTIKTTEYYSSVAQKGESKKYSPTRILHKMQDPSEIILVAKEAGQIAGFLSGHFNDGTFLIDWIGTRIEYRQQHTASHLLSFLEKRVEKRVHKIWCDTRTENKEAIRFFKKHGFKKTAFLKNHWYRQDFFLWEKIL